jgi:hypothetical protein
VLTGRYRILPLKITGWAGSIGEYELQALIINGTAICPALLNGDFNLKALVITGRATRQPIGSGNYVMRAPVISGQGSFLPALQADYQLKALTVSGTASFSPVGDRTGAYTLPKLKMSGRIINPKASYIIQHRRAGT